MKLKFSFRGSLLPFQKQKIYKNIAEKAIDDRCLNYYAVGLFILWLIIVLLSSSRASGQPSGGIQVGEKVPDVTLEHVINYKSSTARLSDFKGKILILDFWATWCTPCVAMLPLMDSLQQEFAGKIQFLPVAYQSETVIRAFLAKRPPSNLPDAVEDKELSALFSHRSVPHYVWIGADGKLLSVTSAWQITRENIRAVLATGHLSVTQKVDIDPDLPLYSGAALPMNNLTNYAIFLKGRTEGSGTGLHFRKTDRLIGVSVTNSPLSDIYNVCGNALIKNYDRKQLLLSVQDSTALLEPKSKTLRKHWDPDNLYSIDLIMPRSDSAHLFDKVLTALNQYTPYTANVEKRRVKCLNLTFSGDTSSLQSKFATNDDLLSDTTKRSAHHIPVRNLVGWLNSLSNNWPFVIDHSRYHGFFDIQINAGPANLQAIRAVLKEKGWALTEADDELPMLVIKDKTNGFDNNN